MEKEKKQINKNIKWIIIFIGFLLLTLLFNNLPAKAYAENIKFYCDYENSSDSDICLNGTSNNGTTGYTTTGALEGTKSAKIRWSGAGTGGLSTQESIRFDFDTPIDVTNGFTMGMRVAGSYEAYYFTLGGRDSGFRYNNDTSILKWSTKPINWWGWDTGTGFRNTCFLMTSNTDGSNTYYNYYLEGTGTTSISTNTLTQTTFTNGLSSFSIYSENGMGYIDNVAVFDKTFDENDIINYFENCEPIFYMEGTGYWLGVGKQYFTISQPTNVPIRYNLCEEWDTLDENEPYRFTIWGDDLIGSYPITKANSCSGDILIPTTASGIPTADRTASVNFGSLDEKLWEGASFLYTTDYEPNWQLGDLTALMPEWSSISSLYPSTSTIEFGYDFRNLEGISTSTHTIWLWNNETNGVTAFSSVDFDDENEFGLGEITITNGTFGDVYNLSLILSENTSTSTIILKSNSFKISFGIQAGTNPEGYEIDPTGEIASSTNWFTRQVYGFGKTWVNLFGNVFPINFINKFYKCWIDSEDYTLPSNLSALNIVDAEGNTYIYFPQEWGGGEEEEILIWGTAVYYTAQTSTIIDLIKALSTYFLWFLFFMGIINLSLIIYNYFKE